ncbi:MAG: hypothetical protein LBS36_07450 [Oscillospiraceae bacterium]|jgi:hypothetical protein|nr:hypothetical protein [Oscillospiraceae bacterium]
MQNDSLLLRLKASKIVGVVALLLLFDSVLVFFAQIAGAAGGILSLLVFAARIGVYIALFLAFKTENQAELLSYEKKNGLLKALQYVSLAFLVIAILSLLLTLVLDAAVANTLDAEKLRWGEPLVRKIKYAIDLVGNVFSNINLIGLFAVKIYLDEDRDKRLRSTSLFAAIIILLHLLAAIAKYLIKYVAINAVLVDMATHSTTLADYPESTIGSGFFNVFTNILVYVSYAVIFFLFEFRRKALQEELAGQKKADETI